MKNFPKISIALFFLLFAGISRAQFSADLETGAIFVNKNDASSSWQNSQGVLNGLDGTLFSYAKDFKNPAKPLLRFRANYSFGKDKKHFVSFLAAPLQYSCSGSFSNPVIFNSTTFNANTATEGFYKFSGYRLTYRYMFKNSEKLKFGLGLTINFRDAEFSLKQGDKYERNYNRGFVPLINTYLNYELVKGLGLLIDGDVFYVDKTGGAIDYLTGLSYRVNDKFMLKSGYRFFSGVGSEKGNVYNSLFVSSTVIGAVVNF